MKYISEKSFKDATEKCSLGKQAIFFFLPQNVPKLRSLRFVDYVILKPFLHVSS